MMLIQLALRELWGSRRQVSIPALALALVVGAFFVLGAFQAQFNETIKQEGRMAMGADLLVRAPRPLAQAELDDILTVLPPKSEHSRIIDFNTMLQAPRSGGSRFVRLHAVESNFPFYGEYQTQPPIKFSDLDQEEALLILPEEVVRILKVDVGDPLRIGEKDFKLAAILLKSPGGVSGFFSFAPKIYIHQRHLAGTRLFDSPARIDYENYFKLPSPSYEPKDFVNSIEDALANKAFSVRTYEESNRGFQRLFSQIQLFGHVVVLTGLVLASFSIFGTLQSWYHDRRYLIAILRCFGASRRQVNVLLLTATLSLSLGASLLGILIGYFVQKFLSPLLASVIQIPESFSLPASLYFSCVGVGVATTCLFSFLAMTNLSGYKPLILIRSKMDALGWNYKKSFISFLLLGFFFLLSFYLVEEFEKAVYLSGGLVVTLGVAALATYFLFRLLAKLPLSKLFAFNYAARSLLRKPQTTILNSSLLFLISCLLAMMLILESALQDEFYMDDQTRRSSLFTFDLGEEEKAEVDAFLASYPSVTTHWAPWVTVRWLAINGREPQEVTESEDFLNKEIQVSFASELPSNNSVVAGKIWDAAYREGLVEVSVMRPYAFRMGIRLGDRLLFSLYGVEFEAIVTSLRQVRFTDFQPFFRFVFQDGFFDGLPFSYLASIETPNDELRLKLLEDFSKRFPHLSVIDIFEVKTNLMEITNRISVALRFILFFLLLVGVSLMAALAREKVSERRYEFATLKCFGASRDQLRGILIVEFSYLSLLPTILGSVFGVILGNLILRIFFALYGLQFSASVLWVPIGLSALVLGVGVLGTQALAKARPRLLLADV